MEKKTQYQPVAHNESTSGLGSEENTLLTGDLKRQRWNARLQRLWQLIGGILFLSVYTVALLAVSKKTNGNDTVDLAPAADYVEYEVREIDYLNWDKSSAFFGAPGKTVDHNWHQLMANHNIGLPKSYMEEVGRLDQGVVFPDGRYFGSMMAFHHLHCLKHIYHTLNPEHYGISKKTGEEKAGWTRHTEYIMCKADTTIETMKWGPATALPLHNVTSTHQCVNWGSLMDYAGSNSVDVFEEGVLVHPKFGKLCIPYEFFSNRNCKHGACHLCCRVPY